MTTAINGNSVPTGPSATLGIAVLGAGRIAGIHARSLRAAAGIRVVGVADPDRAAAEHLATILGTRPHERWEALLEEEGVDAVMICSASSAHAEQVVAAAAGGRHVFCEKPLAPDLAGVDAAVAAVERAGVVLHIGFNRRFDPSFSGLAATMASGRLGRLLQLRITSRDPEPPPPSYPRGPGGLFSDMAIHDFDVARFVSGEEVVAVSAAGANLVDPLAGAAGDIDVATVTLHLASGAIGLIECCRQSTYGYDQRVEVHGSDATAWSTNPLPSTNVMADGAGAVTVPLHRFFPERYEQAYPAELAAFLAACRGGEVSGPAPARGTDARAALVLAIAAQRSLTERRTVAIGEVDGAPGPAATATEGVAS
ncbi:MAG TPA: Gfo/Idh/MocA family oxidoreductase [Acidimicrobiales bacterium]|nr:Gfo/Idh/MocA family oxidoreductase [Acidimicrobiales bacterium]